MSDLQYSYYLIPDKPIENSFEDIIMAHMKTEIRENYKKKVIDFYNGTNGTNENIKNIKELYEQFSQDFEDEEKIKKNILNYVINSETSNYKSVDKNVVGVNLFTKFIKQKINKSYDIAGFGTKTQKIALEKVLDEFNKTMENAYNEFKQTTNDLDSEFKNFFDTELEKKYIEKRAQPPRKLSDNEKNNFRTKYYKTIEIYGFNKNYFEYIILGKLDKSPSANYNYYFYIISMFYILYINFKKIIKFGV
jgi:hypothetical protein